MKLHISALVLLAISQAVYATDQFTYQHQPIHPDCITQLINAPDKQTSISLKSCTIAKERVKSDNGYLTTQDQSNSKQDEFSRYAIIGNKGNHYLIDTGSWTGGTGFFTSIIWVEIKKDKLILLKGLAGGDRCNGGTSKSGDWEYAVNETPYDMLSRSGTEPPIKAYDEIESSAASCVAQSIYRFNPDTGTTTLIRMQLNDQALPIDDYVNEIKYQPCFNKIYNTWLQKGKRTLSQNEIVQFRDQFDKTCLK